MKVLFNLSIMLTVHLNYLLLFLSLFASVCSFPSTPLNERNQEISWEAWLLVDDQNQNQNRLAQDGQIPRRRITPKSVFVAPTFSPENLPPCAEGYSSDPMGRCVKIIKLDEDRHLDFLVSKLNEKFGSSLDYETMLEIDDPDSEPTRLDIPLSSDYGDDYSNDTPQEELGMAIIVTPTTRESDKSKADDNSKLGKRDDNINEEMYEEELKKLLEMSSSTKKYDDATIKVTVEQNIEGDSEESQTTTTVISITPTVVTEEPTTVQTVEEITTTTVAPTTGKSEEESTTLKDEDDLFDSTVQTELLETNVDTTTFTDLTTTLEVTTEVPTTTEAAETTMIASTTTTPKITTYHPLATTYHPFIDLSLMGSESKTKNLVKFPDEEPTLPRSHPDGNFVRFPDVDTKYHQEGLVHHTRNVDDHFFNEIITPQPSQRVQEIVLPPRGLKGYFSGFNHNYKSSEGFYPKFFPARDDPKSFDNSHGPLVNHHQPYQTTTTEKHPVKKSKEKYGAVFQLPSRWSTNEHHKPIVLRFSRKHFNFDTNKFKNSEFYRSLPMDDLTYLFGNKNGQTTHR